MIYVRVHLCKGQLKINVIFDITMKLHSTTNYKSQFDPYEINMSHIGCISKHWSNLSI